LKRCAAIWASASAGAVLAAAGVGVLYTFPPAASSWYPKCVFRAATGLLCPGCGTTRALHQLLHGNVEAAFRLNPMLFAMMLVALCALPSLLRGERPRFLERPWFAYTTLAVLAVYWVVRNTPLYPFPA
jgi:hypothetical protein